MENYNNIYSSDKNIIIITLNIRQLKLTLILLFIIINNCKNDTKETIIDFNTLYFWNYTFLKNEMHNYSLYNEFSNPKISLIIINKYHNENEEFNIIEKIKFIISQNFTNLEILLFLKKGNKFFYHIENELQNLIKNNILKLYNQSD